MKNEIHHTARREAVRGLISKVGRDLASGCTISEPAEYLNRENSLGKASERYASPYQRKDYSLRVCNTLLISCLHKNTLNRKTIENRPRLKRLNWRNEEGSRRLSLSSIVWVQSSKLEPRKCQIHFSWLKAHEAYLSCGFWWPFLL